MQFISNSITALPCSWLPLATSSQKGNAPQLIAISAQLNLRYNDYNNLILNYQNSLTQTSFQGSYDVLTDFYNHAPKELNRLLKIKRNDHGLSRCPYCGNPRAPDTLDHFVPKDDWPEFSIFANNLVPQCRTCAPIKGKKYYCSQNNIVMFTHPFYFNLLDLFRFKINVSFDIENSKPTFEVKIIKQTTVGQNDIARIKLHLEKLDVLSRVKQYCRAQFISWSNKLRRNNFNIIDAFATRLSELPRADIGKDWESAFFAGMMECEEAIQYLHSLRPVGQQIIEEELELEEIEL
ncbi:HNH endonuclease [Aeromonas aquatica]|uniref:HNH endonuclease n=1 Tax=Aeromonas aquatica TaxID=558964 RepID=UPI00126A1FDD|nr:HNH endonuclease [Aeromonas aquatica]